MSSRDGIPWDTEEKTKTYIAMLVTYRVSGQVRVAY
jgi:hypothetical protein